LKGIVAASGKAVSLEDMKLVVKKWLVSFKKIGRQCAYSLSGTE
jgi:hypothetical protein